MREVKIIKNLIQTAFDTAANGVFTIIDEVKVITYTEEEQILLSNRMVDRIKGQIANKGIEGILKTSASRYGEGENISLDFTLSFDISIDLRDEYLDYIETVRQALKASEADPFTSGGYSIGFAMNATTVFNIRAGQSEGVTYVQVLMAGSCTLASTAVLGQSVKCWLKVPSGTYTEIKNIVSQPISSDIKVDDQPINESIIRNNDGLSADGLAQLVIQYDKNNTLHGTLLGYCFNQAGLFDGSNKSKVYQIKWLIGETTLAEWNASILKAQVNIIRGNYITITLDIARTI